MSNYKLINGDCIEEMQKLIDDGVKVDLIVTDPPPKSKEHKEKLSIARNNVGYLNVSRHYSDKYKKGYTWRYSYSENGKRYDIQRVKLGDLEKEVKRRNLKWKRIDNGGDLNIV